jgi:hypothetical protein
VRRPDARLSSAAVALAVAAANKRRPRRVPLSRREALAEAPWLAEMAASGVSQRAFRAAYADRLVELGLALPSTAHLPRPSGPSGTSSLPRVTIRGCSAEQIARWDSAARRAGLDRSAWLRRVADAAAPA